MDKIIKLCEECLQCKNPTCIKGCPVNNDIPSFIKLAKEKRFDEALKVINNTSTLPSICSLVCPSENQCKGHCIKNKINNPVKINEIEQFISLMAVENNKKEKPNGYKVAVIGSGPSGLACSEILAKKGYEVDIYDSYDEAGGILVYGIPSFVLDKDIVNQKIDYIKSLGVKFNMNKKLSKDILLNDLLEKYDAIFLGFGASIGKTMNIEGNKLDNIVDANYFLEKMYKKSFDLTNFNNIIVVGGGNTAIDTARVAKRNSKANVSIVYRRSEKEMPARVNEYMQAINDGISFNFLTNPVRFLGNEKVSKVECIKMELVKVDNDRARPVEIKDSNFTIDADLVVLAISSGIDSNLTNQLQTTSWGGIIVNENMQTSIDKVFAGGDCVNGPSLVVTAMKDGIKAAKSIDEYLNKK